MSIFLIGLVLFVGMHSIYILLPGARTAAIARIGYNPWRGLYSLISLTGLVLLLFLADVRMAFVAFISIPVTIIIAMIAFGARVVGQDLALMIVDAFLDGVHEGGRHGRRVAMIADIEAREG